LHKRSQITKQKRGDMATLRSSSLNLFQNVIPLLRTSIRRRRRRETELERERER
jgi:hypothetical protein